MKLSAKHIVLTGGTSGIGRELVRQLHEENDVLVIARAGLRLERLKRDFPGVRTCPADLAIPSEVEAAASQAREHFAELDILINNAAVQHTPVFTADDFCYTTIQEEVAVNFTAACVLTALLLPAMMTGQEAAIVNINSGLSLMPKRESAVYSATKAALNVFSQSLRHQLEDTNVRVLQAFMPLVDTPMTEGRGSKKLSPMQASGAILRGIEAGIEDHDVGQVRVLRSLVRFAPGIARKIMKVA